MVTAGSNTSAASAEEMATDERIERVQKQVRTARGCERLLKAKIAALDAEPSVMEIRANVMILELEKEELADRLRRLQAGEAKPVPSADREAVEAEVTEWKRKAQRRKKIFWDMWAMAQDGLSEIKSKEQLWEELGLENVDDE
ncbi:MAG: hypothetical protein LQ352_000068 [Teloschistes flavicans]|nr:MAG: hypothetical protein LQ352_000068 [Teloschistes flavicans]